MTKMFSLGAILTVTTGRFLIGDIGVLYDILNYMTGDQLFTHQLPRASRECEGPLLRQHPQLANIVVPKDFPNTEAVLAWLAEQEAQFGTELPVSPLAPGEHKYIDALVELDRMRNGKSKPIIAVVVDE